MTASTAARGHHADRPMKSPLAASHHVRAEPEFADRAIGVARQPELTPRGATLAEFTGYLQTITNRDSRPFQSATVSTYVFRGPRSRFVDELGRNRG